MPNLSDLMSCFYIMYDTSCALQSVHCSPYEESLHCVSKTSLLFADKFNMPAPICVKFGK